MAIDHEATVIFKAQELKARETFQRLRALAAS